MKTTIKFLFIFIILSSPIYAISKKESLNQDKPLLESETMFNAGTWDLYMARCDGKFHKNFRNELARLSWPDYKNYARGKAKYDNNYTPGNCSKNDTNDGKSFYNWIINKLEIKTKNLKINTRDNDVKTQGEENETTESKLKKLKNLFDQNLITQDEFDAKRKKILDAL